MSTMSDNEKKLLQALKGMVEWFSDNFSDETFLEMGEHGEENWIPYTSHDTYMFACNVIDEVEGFTNLGNNINRDQRD